jgi:methionyl-tRNA formyltransferase
MKLADVGAELLLETLPKWLGGELKPHPQDEAQATYSRMITTEDAEIDWHLPAVEIWQKVRAYNPWPGCYTWCRGKRLVIHSSILVGDEGSGEVGEVITLAGQPGIGVVTGQSVLGLCQVQMEGKRAMSVHDFARGKRDFIGCVLGR